MSETRSQQTVAIIDYGMGNLHSAKKAFEKVCSHHVIVTNNANEILAADRVVVPGVGAIRDCMAAIRSRNLDTVIHQVASNKTPLLGICIGLQVLMAHSEENDGVACLGVFPEQVEYFAKFAPVREAGLKVPHMGWNQVAQRPHPLWKNIDDHAYFYFVHSYCAQVSTQHSVGICQYGVDFSAAVACDNVFAVQFHPEKSADNGLQLLKNFCAWKP